MPVLALNGDRAAAGPAASLHRVARDVHTVTVPDAGHYLPEQRPARFAATVLAFLAEPE